MDTVLRNGKVLIGDRVLPRTDVFVRGGRIASVGRPPEGWTDADATVVDASGAYVAPGYIDLHIHGIKRSLADKSAAELADLCRELTSFGVTGFLPTVVPLPQKEHEAKVAELATVRDAGAQILGFFLEGPFLKLSGAIPGEATTSVSEERIRGLQKACGDYPAIFAVAPDAEGVLDLIPLMAEDGTPVFITHTEATVEQTEEALRLGASHATHFYDVFPVPPVTEGGVRPCGAVEAILADPDASVDFILDGVHVHPIAAKMALKCKGPEKVCLITDANIGAGLPAGKYEGLGGMMVDFESEGAPARMGPDSDKPGALAGSGLTMELAVRNAVKLIGVGVAQAVRMASENPARVLGKLGTKGIIAEGADADLILLDEDLRVMRTWVGGKQVYERN